MTESADILVPTFVKAWTEARLSCIEYRSIEKHAFRRMVPEPLPTLTEIKNRKVTDQKPIETRKNFWQLPQMKGMITYLHNIVRPFLKR